MKGTLLLNTPKEIRRHYKIILEIIDANPVRQCIVEHAYDMITEPDLIAQVISCKFCSRHKARTVKDFEREIEPLLKRVILDKGMAPGSDEWQYLASPFAKTVIDYAKKTNPNRSSHL